MPPILLLPALAPVVVIVRELADVAQPPVFHMSPAYVAPPQPEVHDGPDAQLPAVRPPIQANATLTDSAEGLIAVATTAPPG